MMAVMSGEPGRRYRERWVFGPFTAVEPGQVRAVEEEIGRPLPASYREFIEVANGGTLPYAIRVPPGAGGEPVVFESLHSLAGLPRAHRELPGTVFAEAFEDAGADVGALLPIARDGGGSTLLLDLAGGRVCCFRFGLPEWTGAGRGSAAHVLAGDFDGFLDALFIDEETAQWAWEYYVGYGPDDPWRPVVEDWLDRGLPGWRSRPWAR